MPRRRRSTTRLPFVASVNFSEEGLARPAESRQVNAIEAGNLFLGLAIFDDSREGSIHLWTQSCFNAPATDEAFSPETRAVTFTDYPIQVTPISTVVSVHLHSDDA
jgi:hypothetical protein